ncbi:hypothetical protein [Mycobacterium avium]|uniref:hypothetical protein n=1 Tax=Mycobacterium avium TaxID=1764 RepID=UPI0012DAD875|nr:hypothetical protein [Mycobacterium avium]
MRLSPHQTNSRHHIGERTVNPPTVTITADMTASLVRVAEEAGCAGQAPLVSVVYAGGELVAASPTAAVPRRSPLEHGEISLLAAFGYRIRDLAASRTVQPRKTTQTTPAEPPQTATKSVN